MHRLRVIRQLLELGLTVADVRLAADRLDLLDDDRLPREGEACAGTAGIVQHRIAALDAEIVRLTRLRNQLAARVVPPPTEVLASLSSSEGQEPFRNLSVGGSHLHHYMWGIGLVSGVGAVAVRGDEEHRRGRKKGWGPFCAACAQKRPQLPGPKSGQLAG